MSTLPSTQPAPEGAEAGRKARRNLVLAAWILVGLAAIPRVLEARVDGPGLGWFLALAVLAPPLIFLVVLARTVRARLRARRSPAGSQAPGWGAAAWGLGAAVVGGLVAAPMLTSSRAPVRPRAAQDQALVAIETLLGTWDQATREKVPAAELPARLEAALALERPRWRNPYRSDAPAFAPALRRLEGLPDEAALAKALEPLATEPGVVITACQLPGPGAPAFVAAAVRCPGNPSGPDVFVKVRRAD